eukprot:scaffold155753_cov37-Tisochrysis_lutea.AAC.3
MFVRQLLQMRPGGAMRLHVFSVRAGAVEGPEKGGSKELRPALQAPQNAPFDTGTRSGLESSRGTRDEI